MSEKLKPAPDTAGRDEAAVSTASKPMPVRARAAKPSASAKKRAATEGLAASASKPAAKAKPLAAPGKPSSAAKPKRMASATTTPGGPADAAPRKRAKLVRDSFTMPQFDFDLVDALKERTLGLKRPTKKSELLRAGLHVLSALKDRPLLAALNSLQTLKPGRPKKND